METKSYSEASPPKVMRKNRISDLNIKAASVRPPNSIQSLKSDIRISASSEVTNVSMPPSDAVADSERIKERTSF